MEALVEHTALRIHSPANGEFVGEVPVASRADVAEAIHRARTAQKEWGARSVRERCAVLADVKERFLARSEEIVELARRENGKPRHEGLLHEVMTPLELLTYFIGEAERILEPRPIPMRLTKHRASYIHYVPRGVVGVIAPWNFPVYMAYGPVIQALVAGNGVVVKPSEFTPLTTLLVRSIFVEAGLPADLLQVVCGRGDVGAALIEGGVDMVEFTGSVATGRKVAAMCGERLIPCVLELGGKAPALILPDAPMPRTLDGVIWGGFANAGQVCASIERVLVHTSVYDRFVPALVDKVRALRVGDANTDAEIDVGPLVNERQRDIVEAAVKDAVAKGAKVLIGGKRIDGPGYFFEPTVLVDVTTDMDVVNREFFGPILPIQRLSDEDAMIAEANRSHLGLLAYVFTADGDRGRRVAERIEAGTVMVNDVISTAAMAGTPWGGVKNSGLGNTHSDDSLRHMCQERHVNHDLLSLPKELWWYPYRLKDLPMFRRAIGFLYGRGFDRFKRLAG